MHGSAIESQSPSIAPNSDLTPPPSTQIPRASSKFTACNDSHQIATSLASPPATLKIQPSTFSAPPLNNMPRLEELKDLSEGNLREIVAELLPALTEARVTAAHARLQHSLLSLETEEANKRAAVEHDMMRREVEVLQTGTPLLRARSQFSAEPASPSARVQRHLDLSVKRCHTLEIEKQEVEHRLKQAKKIIKQLDGKATKLLEDNQLLRQRIKQNRDHLDAMRSSGAISITGTPRTPRTIPFHKDLPKLSGQSRMGPDAFDALLFAGQVLNGETSSVPSTPTRPRHPRAQQGHIRATHSLSSLPNTPIRSRPLTANNIAQTPPHRYFQEPHPSFSAPSTQFAQRPEYDRTDRDSTISASDHEDEAYTDDDVPGSQASRAATSMLRRSVLSSPETAQRKPLVQSKISGRVIKPGMEHYEHGSKRNRDPVDVKELQRSAKKAKLDGSITAPTGLGIGI